MPMGILFWVFWVLALLSAFGVWWGKFGEWGTWGGGIFMLALFFLLGWHSFGPILR